jgi:hypothetical protein
MSQATVTTNTDILKPLDNVHASIQLEKNDSEPTPAEVTRFDEEEPANHNDTNLLREHPEEHAETDIRATGEIEETGNITTITSSASSQAPYVSISLDESEEDDGDDVYADAQDIDEENGDTEDCFG